MESQENNRSESKDLSSKQLSNIANTLAKASQRRENEVRKRASVKDLVGPVSMPISLAIRHVSNASLLSGIEILPDSGLVENSEQSAGYPKAFDDWGTAISRPDLNPENAESMASSDVTRHHDPDKDNHDATSMLQMLEHSKTGGMPLSDTTNSLFPCADGDNRALPRSTTAINPASTWLKDSFDELGKQKNFNEDLKAHEEGLEDPIWMLAELEGRARSPPALTSGGVRPDHVDTEDDEEDLEALATRLLGLKSFRDGLECQAKGESNLLATDTVDSNIPNCIIESDTIPYIVAIQLEMARKDWLKAKGWADFLFGSGLRCRKIEASKATALKEAEESLNNIIKQHFEDAKHVSTAERQQGKLSRRLIVSNIAAGATEEDLRICFFASRFVIQKVRFLPVRNPNTGTQTAYFDMTTRTAAISTAFKTYAIFGLLLDIQLAVK